MPRRSRARRDDRVVGPSEASWLRRAGLATLAAKGVLVPLVFDPSASDAFVVQKSALSHALTYVLAALLLALVVSERTRVADLRRLVPLGAFGLAASLATVFAVDRYTALYGAFHRQLGLTQIADGLLLACGAALLVRTRRDMDIVVAAVLGGSAAVVAYALVQVAGLDPVRWLDPVVSSTIGNAGALAGYLVVTAATASAFLVAERDRLRPRIRIAIVALVVVSSFVVVRSGARGPTLALPAALAFAAAMGHRVRPLPMRRPRSREIVVTAGLFVLVAAAALTSPSVGRVAGLLSARDTSLAERAIVYQTSIDIVRARPVLGAGPDGLVTLYHALRPAESSALATTIAPTQTSTHSWVLHYAVGTGLVGLGLLLVGIAAAVRRAWPRSRTHDGTAAAIGLAAVAAFLAQGVFNITHVSNDWLFWLGMGLLLAVPVPVGAPASPPSRTRHHVEPAHRWQAAVALGVALAATWTLLAPVDAARAAGVAERLRRTNAPAAVRAAELAVERDSGRADNWNVLGLARSAAENDRALDAFQRAAERAPYDPVYAMNVAKEALRTDDEARARIALEHARRAVELDPRHPETHYVLAFALVRTGASTLALEEIAKAIALRELPEHHQLASDAYWELGMRDRALEELAVGIDVARRLGRSDWPLRLARAQRLIEMGRTADGSAELSAILDSNDAGDDIKRGATRLRAQIAPAPRPVTPPPSRQRVLLFSDVFADASAWRSPTGASVGTVSGGTLRAPSSSWTVLRRLDVPANGVVSIAFRFTGPRATSQVFEVGLGPAEGEGIVVTQLGPESQQTRVSRLTGGVRTQVAAGDLAPMIVGHWYWIEIEIAAGTWTVRVYQSGPAPAVKARASLRGELRVPVEVTFPVRLLTLLSTYDPPVEIGGIPASPGGLYVEEIR